MRGSQEPRICIEPARVATDGTDAALLMAGYGSRLDEWQSNIVNCWLGKDEKGKYTMTSGGLSVPRQNGKNICLEAREFFGLVISGEKILHTAHQVRTSKKSFRRLAAIFTNQKYPDITDLVKTIRYTNGEEGIELLNGGSIEYMSRSKSAARGFEGISLLVYDEAQELTDDQVESIMSTLSASATGTRQIIYTGTPPYPKCLGTVFRRRREECTKTPGPRDAWHEWGVEAKSIDDINIADRNLWYMTNPALGVRLSEEFTEEEMRTMSADGFARERLGWWTPITEHVAEKAIDAALWDACVSDEKKPAGKTAYAVRFTSDGAEVCLCGAVLPQNGPARISLLERKPTARGTQWLADWLNARYMTASCVVIDGRNGVDVLIDKISNIWKAKNSIIRPSARDVVAAVSTLTNCIEEKTLTWYRGQEELRDSAVEATRRPIGGGWGFGGANAAPIEAAALALWGAKTCKRNPAKKMRIG